MQRSFDLAGMGLNATDTAIIVPEFPEYAGKIAFLEERMEAGGQVATAVIACQELGRLDGMKCRYIGTVGDDLRGRFQLASLEASGVDISGVHVIPGCPNQTAYIIIDKRTGERTVFWHRDPRLAMLASQVDRAQICDARLLHVDGCDIAANALAAQWAREASIPVTCDMDTIVPGIDQLIQYVDYFIASATFPQEYTGEQDPHRALALLRKEFGMKLAATTLGHDGVLALTQEGYIYSAAYDVDCLDTTGAGDVFRGAFAYAILRKMPIPRALDFACAAGALNCTAMGARGGIPALAGTEELMRSGSRRSNREYASKSAS